MSRLGSSAITVKPSPNIYTGLAAISMISTLVALGYVAYQWFTVLNK